MRGVIACCDALPTFEPAEHTFGSVAAFVTALVVSDDLLALLAAKDTRTRAPVCQGFWKPIGIVTPVGITQAT